ncbi:response regulator [Larkinella sp. VNQ87]|uniref:response regulator n=1 Tax=Larkinella sp. VNQ87 TaxID=3400921 RepID=UPI003C0F54CA
MNTPRTKKSPGRAKNASILVIEDNPDHQILIKNAIQQSFSGVEALVFSNEQEAVEHLRECALTGLRLPKLILLDLYLPEREDGWNTVEQIKEIGSDIAQIPIVVFSSSAHHEDITESYERGVTSYVVKPTDFSEWLTYFETLKDYWWETVILPNTSSSLY